MAEGFVHRDRMGKKSGGRGSRNPEIAAGSTCFLDVPEFARDSRGRKRRSRAARTPVVLIITKFQ